MGKICCNLKASFVYIRFLWAIIIAFAAVTLFLAVIIGHYNKEIEDYEAENPPKIKTDPRLDKSYLVCWILFFLFLVGTVSVIILACHYYRENSSCFQIWCDRCRQNVQYGSNILKLRKATVKFRRLKESEDEAQIFLISSDAEQIERHVPERNVQLHM